MLEFKHPGIFYSTSIFNPFTREYVWGMFIVKSIVILHDNIAILLDFKESSHSLGRSSQKPKEAIQ